MNKEKIIGISEEGSKSANERFENYNEAKTALEKGQVEALFASYEKAIEDRAKVEESLMRAIGLIGGDKAMQVGNEKPDGLNAVNAMKEVALAAIDLAKTFATQKTK